MASKRQNSGVAQWQRVERNLRTEFPHLCGWLFEPARFGELRLKSKDDGTTLAIAKGYGEDGGPIVCFGVGYDPVLALMAIDATIQANAWRVDKPWEPK